MSKEYSKVSGYNKFYNDAGMSYRIKFEDVTQAMYFTRPKVIQLKFKNANSETWYNHTPKKKFKDVFSIIRHIGKNLENEDMVFNVL